MVVNLHRSDEPGWHWVALSHAPGGRYIEYFDSFGVAPPEEVTRARHGQPLLYSSSAIQDVRSRSCGWLCMDFIRAYLGGRSLLQDLSGWYESFGSRRRGFRERTAVAPEFHRRHQRHRL